MEKTKSKLIRLVVAVGLTLIPIVVFNSVWHIIKVYLPVINATAMILAGSTLIIMYLKGYSWGSIGWRLKNLFVEKQDMRGYMKQRFDPDPLYKSKSVLIVGIILILGAIYLLSQYSVTEKDQEGIRLINDSYENKRKY